MMSLRRRALFFAGLFVAVSCSDAGNPLEPGPTPQPKPGDDAVQALQCTVNVATSTMECGPRDPDAGTAQAAQMITGGKDSQYVNLDASNFTNPTATSLEFDVTVQNLMRQALGTENGDSLHADGVRVWFAADPAGADVALMDGTDILMGGPTPYFQYDTIVRTGETADAKRWRFENYAPGTTNIQFFVYVVAHVQYPNGWIEITPSEASLAPGGTVDLNAVAYHKQADIITNVSQVITFSSNREGVATVHPSTGLVTASSTDDSVGVVTITATNTTGQSGTATIVVNTDPVVNPQNYDAVTNVTMHVAAPGVLAGASDADNGQTITVVPQDSFPTAQGGVAWIEPDGELRYVSPAGFVGTDVINFDVDDGLEESPATATVDVVSSNYWYVKAGGNGDGRDHHPFGTLDDAKDAAAAVGPGGTILVLHTAGQDVSGPVTLEQNQSIIGQGIPTAITVSLNGETVTVLNDSSASTLTSAAGSVITLGTGNTIRGVAITAPAGSAIISQAPGFGTLTASDLSASAGGPVLDLNDGALSAVFTTLSSTGSTGAGLSLEDVTGSLTSTGGAISGAAGAAVEVIGGSVSVTYGGNVTQGNNAPLLNVTSSHATGTLAFNGTLSATAGDGLQFNAAGGTYNFNGTTTLNGGNAGVDITNGSAGTFAFGTGTSITSPTGSAFTVYGSSPVVTYSGNITKGNAGLLVEVGEQPGGSVTFNTGTLQATAGDGISLSNADGANSFNGTTTLNGGNAGVDVVSQSSGAISFGSGASIGNASGNALHVANGGAATNVTFAGGITSSATGLAAHVEGVSSGSVTASGSISGANGIVVQNNTGGTITFSGAKTLNTGTGNAVTLTNNPGTTINLTGGALGITTGTGTGILGNGAGGFGSLTVNNATVNANGPALNLTNGTLNGTFNSLTSTNSATSGVTLTTVNGTLNTSGGTISGAAGTAFNVSGGNLAGTIATGISQGNNASLLTVAGGHNTGTLTFSGNVSATNGNGVQFTDADGTYTFTGTFSLNGSGDEGIDIAAASTGTVNVTPAGGNTAEIVSPSGIAISIAGGSLNYSGNVTQATAAMALLSVTGGHTGTVSFPSGTLTATNGTGLQFDNADGTYSFGGTVALSNGVVGADAGIDITNGSAGTFTFPTAASITNPIGSLITILNSAPSFTYSGGLTKNNTSATAILAQSNTGGTITFNGDATSADGDPADVARTISTGSAIGVSLVSNGSATVNFNGGGLAITTTTGAGFNATGGGTINVTGAGNVISSGTGTALNVQNTTIGASGLSFLSISHSGGANGIHLANTGNTNGMQVTGTAGVNGSGGTITSTTGGDGATGGNGIYLSSVRNVNLSWMALSGHANNGLYGSGVRGLTMNKMRFTGTNGTSSSGTFDESAVNLVNLGGAVKVTNSRFDGGAYNAFRVENSLGTAPVLDSLVLENDTVTTMQGSTADVRGTALLVSLMDGTADTRIRSNLVTAWWANGIHVLVQGTASGTTRITNNFVDNTNGALAGAGGIAVVGGNHAYNISNNTVRHTHGTAISADRVNFGTNMNGTVSGNTIGVSGDNNSGSASGNAVFASHHGPGTTTHRIMNNTIRQAQAASGTGAIWVLTGDASGFGGSGTFNVTVTGNDIQESGTPTINAHSGILATIGTSSGPPNDTDQVCLDIGGSTAALRNNIANFNTAASPTGHNRIRVNQRFGTTSRFPGYTGAQLGVTSQTDLATYLLGRNTASNSTNANTSTGGFNNTSPAGSACPQPTI